MPGRNHARISNATFSRRPNSDQGFSDIARRRYVRDMDAGVLVDDVTYQSGLRFAYVDPPYIGQARKHYGSDEVDHRQLIARLDADYDGWALSASSSSLHTLLPMCPPDTRIAAWVKPFASFKPGVNPAFAWEPVLFRGSRKRERDEDTVRDWCSANITLKKGLSGAKPIDFCNWIIDLLGARPGEDELDEIFPGTAILTRVWRARETNPVQMGLA